MSAREPALTPLCSASARSDRPRWALSCCSEHPAGDPAAAMHDAQHRHGIASVVVSIDDNERRHNADANVPTERGTGRAAARMIGEAIIKPFENRIVFGGR